ncbi:uncharacterized protein LOC112043017 [Bicyclus anynana]|uniref:Uncharacterized protein LOC112043017 n=1 Tax=Bicyclus anynana TaxID=110368 RepID=A0A6J1MFW8_BICAN|nr:uncharacterized protein LOC112043017 [Bicyclus anynana]
METAPKVILPTQEGPGNGESLTAPSQPATAGSVAAVCPTYSGGGKVPPRAQHAQRPICYSQRTDGPALNEHTTIPEQRTPQIKPTRLTLTDTMDNTINTSSLAAALPPPNLDSAWTQVVPRHKRRKNKNKRRKRTNKRVGEELNRPMARTGGDTQVTGNNRIGGSDGPSGTGLQSTSGGSSPAVNVASRPGTNHTTGVFPSRPAKGIFNPNSNAQSLNIPAQRRTHPAACNSSGRSGGEADGKGGNPAASSSTSQSGKKRDRLDDTISPRGLHKRQKTERRTRAGATYASVAQPHLSVAIALQPKSDLTNQEAVGIQSQISKEIIGTCLQDPIPGLPLTHAPVFTGKAILSEGVLKLWCKDEPSLQWLHAVVPRLKSPRENHTVVVQRQCDIPSRIKTALYVPDYDGDIGTLHRVLSRQNPAYDVKSWSLYNYKRTNSRPPGVFLVMGIPQEQIEKILSHERRMAYMTGSIYLRFFRNEELSEIPPGWDLPPASKMETETTGTKAADSKTEASVTKTPGKNISDNTEPDFTAPGPSAPPSSDGTPWEGCRESEEVNSDDSDGSMDHLNIFIQEWAPGAHPN